MQPVGLPCAEQWALAPLTLNRNLTRLLQHGLGPRIYILAIHLCILRTDIQNRLAPRGLVNYRHAVPRFDLELPFSAIDQILILPADVGRRLIFDEELSQ